MTVKDKDGNLYRVEEAPADSGAADTPDGGSGTGSGTSDKKLKVTPLGKTGAALPAGSVNYERLDYEMAEVVFTDVPDSRYAFDQWEDVYGSSLLIRDNYERIGMKYYVSSKLLPSGKSDKVGAQIKVVDSLIVPSKVVFMTPQGTEFKVESFDPVSGRYVLYLTGGERNDGQEVYALHPKKGGGYYNLGKLLVVSYPEYTLKVKVAETIATIRVKMAENGKLYTKTLFLTDKHRVK